MADDKVRCLAAGMDDYVAKPVKGRQLETALDRWLGPAVAMPAAAEVLDRHAPGAGGVAAAVEDPVVLDLELFAALGDLAAATGDPAFLQTLVEQYLVEIPPLLTKLQESVSRGDMIAVGGAAHGLKGSSGAIGANLVALECAAVEAAARSGRVAVDGLDRLSTELARAASAMRAQSL